MHIIDTVNFDILIQEPYTIHNKPAEITSKYRTYFQGENRIRAAIILANKQIDGVLIRQLTDEDVVTVEIRHGNFRCYAVSMYMDGTVDPKEDYKKLDTILNNAKDTGVLLSIDSNCRSSMWHDVTTNARFRRIPEHKTTQRNE
ncbi:hypothetical protein C0J52_11230 [Blattella germanica]|nr:hypothetical protein C0J52_11230 [Blattella germanica]